MGAAVRVTPMAAHRGDAVGAIVSIPGQRPAPVVIRANVPLSVDATPWLSMAVPLAMRLGAPLEVDGPVDEMALSNAASAQEVLATWFPAWQRVPVSATTGAVLPRADGVGAFFSGGLDSTYTAITRSDEITHLIFVTGFDVDHRDDARAARVLAEIRVAAEGLGKPLIEVVTNVRDLSDPIVAWDTVYHGAAMGAVAQSLAGTLGMVIVPGSWPLVDSPIWGSHPDLDEHWSSSRVAVFHDSSGGTRVDKVRLLASVRGSMDNLRVCWQNVGDEFNCGVCEKCIRTKVNLVAAGVADGCPTLPGGVDAADIARLGLSDAARRFAVENLQALQESGARPDLAAALSAYIEAAGAHARGPEGI